MRGPDDVSSGPLIFATSAEGSAGAAALADVAGPGGTHLRAAGHADRCVGGHALELLQELGRGADTLDLTGRGCAGAELHVRGVSLGARAGPLDRLGLAHRGRLGERLELALDL